MKKKILEAYVEQEKPGDKPRFYWEFFGELNAYTLIGLLETIKQGLLDEIDEKSIE